MSMKAQTKEEATGMSAEDHAYWESLNIPDHHGAILEGLKPWEYEFSKLCQYLIWTRRMQNRPAETKAAYDIGEHLAKELLRGNFSAPRILAKGLASLQSGGPFRKKTRPPSPDLLNVLEAYYWLKREGFTNPSQSEVGVILEARGNPLSRQRLSKLFDELGLKSDKAKASSSQSPAGKRKRSKKRMSPIE
jgi:hypothetical protein